MSAVVIKGIEQGTPEWHALRLGIPTASCFDKIITPAKGEPSKSQEGYMLELLAEWLSGRPTESYTSGWMERGKTGEEEARDFYSFDAGKEVERVTFVYQNEDRLLGCSPDGLIGDDGALEIKFPSPKVHLKYLLDGTLPLDYKCQVHGTMLVTGRAWVDFLSYCPGLPEFKLRVHRDVSYLAQMEFAMNKFVQEMLRQRETLKQRGYRPAA